MTMATRLRLACWNLLMLSVVLLPSFLIVLPLELTLRGVPPKSPFLYHAGQALVDYVGLWPPMAVGSVIHSLVLMLLPASVLLRAKKAAGYFLALCVPVVAMLLDTGTNAFLSSYVPSIAIATLAYAYATTAGFLRYSTLRESSEASAS